MPQRECTVMDERLRYVARILENDQMNNVKEGDDAIWLVSFVDYDLGYIDLEQRTLQPIDNPFGTRLVPMS